MKSLSRNKLFFVYFSFVTALLYGVGCSKKSASLPPKVNVCMIATGFTVTNGVAVDSNGHVWVADQGTGNNDGRVWLITPVGGKTEAIIHLQSFTTGAELDGPSHLLFADGLFYIMGAKGKMYKADSTPLTTNGPAIEASSLAVENIGAFVLSYPFIKNTHMKHSNGITKAPDGSFYITDAAANAVLHRSKTGVYAVVSKVPGVPNPLPMGPPVTERVPASIIVQDGHLLVSTLLGFPFFLPVRRWYTKSVFPGRSVFTKRVLPAWWILLLAGRRGSWLENTAF